MVSKSRRRCRTGLRLFHDRGAYMAVSNYEICEECSAHFPSERDAFRRRLRLIDGNEEKRTAPWVRKLHSRLTLGAGSSTTTPCILLGNSFPDHVERGFVSCLFVFRLSVTFCNKSCPFYKIDAVKTHVFPNEKSTR